MLARVDGRVSGRADQQAASHASEAHLPINIEIPGIQRMYYLVPDATPYNCL